jgi:hypothetical protein
MNDDFLYHLREQPSAPFATGLRERLDARDTTGGHRPAKRRPRIVLEAIAAVALVAALFTLPAVRASAQSFLSLFRVGTFLGVQVDSQRASELARSIDLEGLLGGRVKSINLPGPPQDVATPELASAAAGYDVRLPSVDAGRITTIGVAGATAVEISGDTTTLRMVMDALRIDDLDVPSGLDGRTITVRVSPIVATRFEGENAAGRYDLELLQAPAPEISLPADVDLDALGEIALRILGLAKSDAHDIAQSVDWHTTVLVPLPPAAEEFRQVPVAGGHGLLVKLARQESPAYMLLWSADGRAYGLKTRGGLTEDQVLAIANSIQ